MRPKNYQNLWYISEQPELQLITSKKIIRHQADFAVPVSRVKIKESEYSWILQELKKPWNMKLTVILTVVDTLGTGPKGG